MSSSTSGVVVPEIPTAPPGGPPSTTCSTSVVAATGLWWWLLLDIPAAPPRGRGSDRCLAKLGTCRQYFSDDTYHGATTVPLQARQVSRKNEDKLCGKIFLGPCSAKNQGIITSLKFKSTNYGTTLFNGMTKRRESRQQGGRPTCLQARVRNARLR
jgi:hypothetical protein